MYLKWKQAMDDEMDAPISPQTWDLAPTFSKLHVISYRWVFIIKHCPDGATYRYKARLYVRGFIQTYGVDYLETFVWWLISTPSVSYFFLLSTING